MFSSIEILDRIKTKEGIPDYGGDTRLANFLGISKQTLSNWKKNNYIDLSILYDRCHKYDFNWLIKGESLSNSFDFETQSKKNDKGIQPEIDSLKKENLMLKAQNDLLREQVNSVLTRSSSERGAAHSTGRDGDKDQTSKPKPRQGLG